MADRADNRADAIAVEDARLRLQAERLRELAEAKEQQAQAHETEAAQFLAEASEAREDAIELRTEADAFIARAQAAEALAAEYRALAQNPPSAQIATHYLYDPEGRLLGEYDEAGQVEREYVYLEGMPLALIAPSGIYYYHTDHLGTPESLTDSDQTVVWQAHHDPFGRASVTTQTVVNNLRFPGQHFDAETALHYNYFRDYDPSLGRYIQSDPIGLAGGLNTYSYVTNNPLTLIDPQGLLFGGLIDAGESYGDSSAQYWADQATQSGNPLYHVPGALAALWTPDTSDATAATLVCGAGIVRYFARPFWQYYPLENLATAVHGLQEVGDGSRLILQVHKRQRDFHYHRIIPALLQDRLTRRRGSRLEGRVPSNRSSVSQEVDGSTNRDGGGKNKNVENALQDDRRVFSVGVES